MNLNIKESVDILLDHVSRWVHLGSNPRSMVWSLYLDREGKEHYRVWNGSTLINVCDSTSRSLKLHLNKLLRAYFEWKEPDD